MNIQGYRIAHLSCIHADLGDGVTLPLASAPGLVIMKLLAWADQGLARGGRDAQDFMTFLEEHRSVLGDDTLFSHHLEVKVLQANWRLRSRTLQSWLVASIS